MFTEPKANNCFSIYSVQSSISRSTKKSSETWSQQTVDPKPLTPKSVDLHYMDCLKQTGPRATPTDSIPGPSQNDVYKQA